MIRNLFSQKLGLPSSQQKLTYWLLLGLIFLLFIAGGSSRSDIPSLVVIRPLAVIALAYGIYHLRRNDIDRFRWHVGAALALFIFALVQVLPLPPIIWENMNGRNLFSEISKNAGSSQYWRPLSLAPDASWNAIFALVVPLAVLVLAISVDRDSRFGILGILLIMGLINIVIGLLQAVDSDSPLYFYQIRAGDFPSGLFSNRNHYAVFLSCMIPMLAVYLSNSRKSSRDNRWKIWLACCFAITIIPLILVTGSRAGIWTTAVGIMTIPFLYRAQHGQGTAKKHVQKSTVKYVTVALGVTAMVLITIFASRAESIDRLFDDGGSAFSRISMWQPIINIAETYGGWGSGVGTFAPVYQVGEPLDLLTFQYVPHAHNDLLEVILTAGWLGIVFMVCLAVGIVFAAWRHFRADISESRDVLFGRLGLVILGLLVIASIVDYPLRVPALASLFAVASIWAFGGGTLSVKKGSGI